MMIDWMEFENVSSQQRIERIKFQRLTLLVGPSAAGKSQILQALSSFVSAVVRESPIPVKGRFQMGFHIGKDEYCWKISTVGTTLFQDIGVPAYTITEERLDYLLEHGELDCVFRRTDTDLHMKDYEKLPSISEKKSVLSIYRKTQPMQDIVTHFAAVSTLMRQRSAWQPISAQFVESTRAMFQQMDKSKEIHMDALQKSDWPIAADILLAKLYMPDDFRKFLEDLQEIFSEIEDIVIRRSRMDTAQYVLAIRQDDKEIIQPNVSSGMLRTIFLLASIHFRGKNSVMLFDEPENSLGINCLDEVVDRIRIHAAETGTQFILTSHHPYIINQIPAKNWLIVHQSHGVISTRKPESVGVGTGHRERFFELMNYCMAEERRNV